MSSTVGVWGILRHLYSTYSAMSVISSVDIFFDIESFAFVMALMILPISKSTSEALRLITFNEIHFFPLFVPNIQISLKLSFNIRLYFYMEPVDGICRLVLSTCLYAYLYYSIFMG